VAAGRDKDATWRSTGTLCRELDWSRPRLIYELQHGLPCQTIPPGHEIDWHNEEVKRTLDIEASTVTINLGLFLAEGPIFAASWNTLTLGIEVLPPPDAELPAPPADTPAAASASVTWAIVTTRDLQAANKIPDGATKTELARLLETEAQTAVKAGKISRALKASYRENQLIPWGIWPLK
jgi:hypothetical protein